MCESEWSWQADKLRKIIHMYMYSITHLVIHNTTFNNTHMVSFTPSPSSLTIYLCVLHVISLHNLSKYSKGQNSQGSINGNNGEE